MPAKLTTKEFIERSEKIHNQKYSYNSCIYIDCKTKVEILCPNHGLFVQNPYNHLLGQGCSLCGKIKKADSKRKSIECYIKKFNEVHNNKYDYSKLKYKGYHEKSEITCPKHGDFFQILSQHLNGFGCPKCKYERFSENYGKNPTGWSLTQWKIAATKSKRFDSFKVYVIRCWNENEEFYKIGRTYLSVKYRFIGCLPYNYRIVKEILGGPEMIFKMENKLKQMNKEFKYVPKLKFGGMHECFSNIKDINYDTRTTNRE